jgi:hypothetical protein
LSQSAWQDIFASPLGMRPNHSISSTGFMTRRRSITMGRRYWLYAVLLLACMVSPAAAGQYDSAADICYLCRSDTIYGLTNLIAYLEAEPDVDDAFKGPIISKARAKIRWLRAALVSPPSVAVVPCCYSRKPLYIGLARMRPHRR